MQCLLHSRSQKKRLWLWPRFGGLFVTAAELTNSRCSRGIGRWSLWLDYSISPGLYTSGCQAVMNNKSSCSPCTCCFDSASNSLLELNIASYIVLCDIPTPNRSSKGLSYEGVPSKVREALAFSREPHEKHCVFHFPEQQSRLTLVSPLTILPNSGGANSLPRGAEGPVVGWHDNTHSIDSSVLWLGIYSLSPIICLV